MKKIKMLVLSLTGKCNFSCVYCYAVDHNQNEMSLKTAVKAVNLAAGSGEKFILQFSGGEPLLAFNVLKEIVLYVKEQKIPALLQIQTNASLITQEIAEFLYHNKVGIGISLDGRPAMNDQMRLLPNGNGATSKILQGMDILKKQGIAVGITCVVTKANVKELPGIVDMAYYFGNVRKIGFDLLRGQGRGSKLEAPDGAEVETAVGQAYKAAEKFADLTGVEMKFAQTERVEALKREKATCFGHCYAMNCEAAFVDAAGNIYACSSLVGNPEFYLGDVNKGIDKERQEKVGAFIKQCMNFCFACSDFKLCGGGCFTRWYGSSGKKAYQGECALKRASIDWVCGEIRKPGLG